MEDEKIIGLLFERSERGLDELKAKYGKLCESVACGLLNDRQSAEECVSDVYLNVWNTIPPTRPKSLIAYICRLARNRAVDMLRSSKALKRGRTVELEKELDGIVSFENAESGFERGALNSAINSFLGTCTRDDRVLFMRRYFFGDTVSAAAERAGITPNNASVRLNRLRGTLKDVLLEKGFDV